MRKKVREKTNADITFVLSPKEENAGLSDEKVLENGENDPANGKANEK